MSDGAFHLDSIELHPQPDKHNWKPEQEQVLGYDGTGLPIKAKYRPLQLTVERILDGQSNWWDFDDGATHTLIAPAPGSSGSWTTYTTVTCVVSHGEVEDAEGMRGLQMTIMGAEA